MKVTRLNKNAGYIIYPKNYEKMKVFIKGAVARNAFELNSVNPLFVYVQWFQLHDL